MTAIWLLTGSKGHGRSLLPTAAENGRKRLIATSRPRKERGRCRDVSAHIGRPPGDVGTHGPAADGHRRSCRPMVEFRQRQSIAIQGMTSRRQSVGGCRSHCGREHARVLTKERKVVKLADPRTRAAWHQGSSESGSSNRNAHFNLERAVGRSSGCVPRGVQQGTTRRNSHSIPTSCNVAGRRAGRALAAVATFTQQVTLETRQDANQLRRLRVRISGQLLFLGSRARHVIGDVGRSCHGRILLRLQGPAGGVRAHNR